MAEITTGTPIPAASLLSSLQAAAVAEESKIVAFIKAHYSKLISAGVGFAAAKVGVVSLIMKLL